MSIFKESEMRQAQALAALMYANPFLPERLDHERRLLGSSWRGGREGVWSIRADDQAHPNENVERIGAISEHLAAQLRDRLKAADGQVTAGDSDLYLDVVLYCLFHRYRDRLSDLIERGSNKIRFYGQFTEDYLGFVSFPALASARLAPAHVLACFFQVRRTFHHIFSFIVGGSLPTAKLRAAVWQSVFTCDMRRYVHQLYQRMGDITTLITGPSGTGKELVARAIALSRYIAVDDQAGEFEVDFRKLFHPLNLSALSPTLIESELFGHRRGAFTGALQDRVGWLETCPAQGSVFLDEVGEIAESIQVKLLRVLEARTFQPLGDTVARDFLGKIIAATNRDLAAEMAAGRCRQDFYYRLCSDTIRTPSLCEQLADAPDELRNLVKFLTGRIAGEAVAESLADEVVTWIAGNLGADYPWPGNVRELEQCARNVMIHRRYEPAVQTTAVASDMLAAGDLTLTADELLDRYCAAVYDRLGSYEAAARRLQLDRRTVKRRVDAEHQRRQPE